jgi:uncharacterized sporulation protein YeaH/YhbH (DUF444 family)
MCDNCVRLTDELRMERKTLHSYMSWAVKRELGLQDELYAARRDTGRQVRESYQRNVRANEALNAQLRAMMEQLANMRAIAPIRMNVGDWHVNQPHRRSIPTNRLIEWRDTFLRLGDVEAAQDIERLLTAGTPT